jgi:hypothetical protein
MRPWTILGLALYKISNRGGRYDAKKADQAVQSCFATAKVAGGDAAGSVQVIGYHDGPHPLR